MTLSKASAALANASSALDGAMSPSAFAEELKRLAAPLIKGRQLRVSVQTKGTGQVFVQYINLPEGFGGEGGGAERENNRLMLVVTGFARSGEDVPAEKVRVETSISFHVGQGQPSEKLRAKAASPGAIAAYIAKFLGSVADAHEPKWTHTAPGNRPA